MQVLVWTQAIRSSDESIAPRFPALPIIETGNIGIAGF